MIRKDHATVVDLGIGGSSNAVLHILAIAYELGISYSLDEFDSRNDIPCICGARSTTALSSDIIAEVAAEVRWRPRH